MNLLLASTGFSYHTFDNIYAPQTELLVLDANQDEYFDLEQAHQLSLPNIPVGKSLVKDYHFIIHELQYTRQWNQMKKEILNFDVPVFFFHSTLYSTENLPSFAFISQLS